MHYFLFTFTANKFFLLQSKSDDEFEIIEMQVNLFIQPLLALDRASNVFEIDSVDNVYFYYKQMLKSRFEFTI